MKKIISLILCLAMMLALPVFASDAAETAEPSDPAQTAEPSETAEPAEGYALKEWIVTDGSGTDKTYAAAGNTFTFHSYADEHHVSAVFVPLEEVAKTVTLNVTDGGSIVVTDGGTVLTPDEDGKLTVPQGTILTFEAVADQYYTFENWTGAFAGYENDVTSITLKIESDVTVGAVFDSFLAYTLTYGTQSVDGGSGTLTAMVNGIDVQSGVTLTPGTTVDFDAAAGSDSRIQKWAVTETALQAMRYWIPSASSQKTIIS